MSNRKPKPSPAIVQQRTLELLAIILDGAVSPWDTCSFVREKEAEPGSAWHVSEDGKPLSDSQIRRYVARANQLIVESCRASRKRLLRRHLAQRRNLYAKAVSQGDVRAALACLDSEAKLTGLFDDEVTRLIDQLQKQVAELKAQYGNGNPPPATSGNGSGPENAPPAGAAAAGGADTPRSGAGDAPGRPVSGPVAGEVATREMDEGPPPLFETVWEESSRRSAGLG